MNKVEPGFELILNAAKSISPVVKGVLLKSKDTTEFLDQILKVLGDASAEENTKVALNHLLQDVAASSLTLTLDETEFFISTLQNVYGSIEKSITLKIELLNTITLLLLLQPTGSEFVGQVVTFLATVARTVKTPLRSCALYCLIEIQQSVPEMFEVCVSDILWNCEEVKSEPAYLLLLSKLACAITDLEKQRKVLDMITKNLATVDPYALIEIVSHLIPVLRNKILSYDLQSLCSSLALRYSTTYNSCILHSLALLLEFSDAGTKEVVVNCLIRNSIHSGLPVARNLLCLDWLASIPAYNLSTDQVLQLAENLIPGPFDGADSYLKKLAALLNVTRSSDQGGPVLHEVFQKLVAFASRNQSSRSLAAIFRALVLFLNTSHDFSLQQHSLIQILVNLAVKTATVVPHLIDFLQYLRRKGWTVFCADLVAKLVSELQEVPVSYMETNLLRYLPFWIEATKEAYSDCQPRVIINTVRHCIKAPKTLVLVNEAKASGILDLCQQLIKNQDIEIFHPELDDVLTSLEKSHKSREIRQRTWMLCSLIANFQSDELRNALDLSINFQKVGNVETSEEHYFTLSLLEPTPDSRPYEVPVEVTTNKALQQKHPVVYGVKIELAAPESWGSVESIQIPVLETSQPCMALFKLQPKVASSVFLIARCTFITPDGCIQSCPVADLHIPIHQQLLPLRFSENQKNADYSGLSLMNAASMHTTIMCVPGTSLLADLESGKLARFRIGATLPLSQQYQAIYVTPSSNKILTRVIPREDGSVCVEAAIEESSLFPVFYSLFSTYCQQ